MTLRGLFLAAQEACLIQQFRGYFPFSPSCGEQCQKVPLVNRPASLAFLESVQDLLRRRQVRTMVIIDPADRPEEIAEIIPLGKTASWETLLSRMSITRLTLVLIKRVKNGIHYLIDIIGIFIYSLA